jgi:hypothetical protein
MEGCLAEYISETAHEGYLRVVAAILNGERRKDGNKEPLESLYVFPIQRIK